MCFNNNIWWIIIIIILISGGCFNGGGKLSLKSQLLAGSMQKARHGHKEILCAGDDADDSNTVLSGTFAVRRAQH